MLDLELEKLGLAIEQNQPKTILIQLPDGLKPKAREIQQYVLHKYPQLRMSFWLGSCYGACDVPSVKGFDLFVQFGHSEWR